MKTGKDNEIINNFSEDLSEEDYDWEEEKRELEEFRAGLRELGGAGFIQSNIGTTIIILAAFTVFVLLFGEKLRAITLRFYKQAYISLM